MSSEPTLEEIAANGTDLPPRYPTVLDSVLARELIALRDGLDQQGLELIRAKDQITALEQQSRAYAEDGALAAGRGAGDGPGTIIARQRGLWDAIDRFQDEVSAATGWSIVSAKAYEGEFIRFVDKAIAQRDTARAALRKYGSHDGTCESWEHAITHGRAACTCGLSDALAGGEANEGSES